MARLAPELLIELRAIESDPQATFNATGFCVKASTGSSYFVKTGSSIRDREQYQGTSTPMYMTKGIVIGLQGKRNP